MFLQSPACTEDTTRPGWEYNPYDIRLEDHADVLPSRSTVDKGIANFANNVHIQDSLHSMPFWMLKMGCKSQFKTMFPAANFTEE